jgi:neurotransmitter:Na+ symporter, NSS family
MQTDPETPPREQWATRTGFILATLGSAIGLGNIWRFSYVAGENGGGAFLIVYCGALILIGLPLLLAELALGRRAQGDVVQTFADAGPRNPLRFYGYVAVVGAGLILSYYSVVAGWVLRYFFDYLFALFQAPTDVDHADQFVSFISDTWQPLAWHLVFLVTTFAVVAGGVRRGIEKLNRLILPLLGIMVIGLAVRGMTLPGGMDGARFLLSPEWRMLAEPRVYLAALGQAFFSIGLGMGILVTYGSYLGRSHRLPTAALAIAGGDAAFAIVAGLAIFPAVFAFGLAPEQGPLLAFITLPHVFATMPGGTLTGLVFFALLFGAALTSAVSLLEVPVAYVTRRFGLSRRRAAAGITLAIFLLGLPSSLGFGPLEHIQIMGRGILDAVDQTVSAVLLPIGGLVIAIMVGWVLRSVSAAEAADLQGGYVSAVWLGLLRYVVPLLIVAILLGNIGLL